MMRRKKTPLQHGWVYAHPKWKELRAAFIAQFGERCCDPRHDHRQPTTRIDLDHKKELEDGGAPFDPNNLVLRCRSCHGVKTKAAQRQRFLFEGLKIRRVE